VSHLLQELWRHQIPNKLSIGLEARVTRHHGEVEVRSDQSDNILVRGASIKLSLPPGTDVNSFTVVGDNNGRAAHEGRPEEKLRDGTSMLARLVPYPRSTGRGGANVWQITKQTTGSLLVVRDARQGPGKSEEIQDVQQGGYDKDGKQA
jgi:hypothetical protein